MGEIFLRKKKLNIAQFTFIISKLIIQPPIELNEKTYFTLKERNISLKRSKKIQLTRA